MLVRISQTDTGREARQRLGDALRGPVDVADSWLSATGGVALLEESARAPDDDQAERLAQALSRLGHDELLAVASEDLAGTDEAYRLSAVAGDLNVFAYARSGLNYALMPVSGLEWLVLCTVHDYLCVAGPEVLINDYAGDPAVIAAGFRAFIGDDPQWRSPESRRLLRHLDWIER